MFNKKELQEKDAKIKLLEEALEAKGTYITLLEKEAISREERINLIEREAVIKQKRHLAEFDKFRKRKDKEIDTFKKFANEILLTELITVADCLEQHFKFYKDVNGLDTIYELLQSIFKKKGLVIFNPLGEVFDPAYHEAIATTSTGNSDPDINNRIVEVYQKGYMHHERLMRPATVVVVKKE